MLVTRIKSVLAVVIVGLALGGIGLGFGLSSNSMAMAQQLKITPDGKVTDAKADWRIGVLDEQIAKLQEERKRTQQEAERLNERSAAITRSIGDLIAARERYSKQPIGKRLVEKQPMTKEEKLRVLIDRVLAAHGGEDRLSKLQFTMTVKHSNGYINKYWVQPPEKFRWETTFPNQAGRWIVILFPEGRRWWTKEPNEEAKEFIPTGVEAPVEFWLDYVKFFGPRQVLRLKDAGHKVALLDEEATIGGRAAVGVEITFPNSAKGRMYFDKESHLLLKGYSSSITREVTYSDYKQFDGIPIAQREHDGHFDPVVTDFKVVEKFDARLFDQP